MWTTQERLRFHILGAMAAIDVGLYDRLHAHALGRSGRAARLGGRGARRRRHLPPAGPPRVPCRNAYRRRGTSCQWSAGPSRSIHVTCTGTTSATAGSTTTAIDGDGHRDKQPPPRACSGPRHDGHRKGRHCHRQGHRLSVGSDGEEWPRGRHDGHRDQGGDRRATEGDPTERQQRTDRECRGQGSDEALGLPESLDPRPERQRVTVADGRSASQE